MSDETALALPAETNLRLVALDPAQLQRSQQQLIAWAAQKMAHVAQEVADFKSNLEIATKSKWNTARPKAALKLAEGRLLFYSKIKDALEAGYYIVPDFPCDIFAIRTERYTPKPNTQIRSYSNGQNTVPDEKSQILPSGEGENRNPQQLVSTTDASYINAKGEGVSQFRFEATGWDEIDFPFALAKPQILDATQRAMALKIFDEMAVAPAGSRRSTKPDPMVLGYILGPKRGFSQKKVAFLVAWFLDTETL